MSFKRWEKLGQQQYVGFPEPVDLDHLPLRDDSAGAETVEAYWEPSQTPFGGGERVLRPGGSLVNGLEAANRSITPAEYKSLDDTGRELLDYLKKH